ncbi:MAG: ATP-binding protein [Phycisphaerales bacterium]|nr:ATP-binding protein [Phycisphaerales bacterium]
MGSSRVELNITSHTACLPVVRGAVERMAGLSGFTDDDAHGLTLAIDEALANVIKHGYDGREDQPITVQLSPVTADDGRRGIEVQVRDQGRQTDPGEISGRPLDEVRPGGLGVHIIRAVMDECDYSCPPEGGMLLRMVKYVSLKKGAQTGEADRPAASTDA